jgi:hypothetical protein
MYRSQPALRPPRRAAQPFRWLPILMLTVLVTACELPSIPIAGSVSSGVATATLPPADVRAVSLVATIQDVDPASRALTLVAPTDGVTRVLVPDDSGIHQVGRTGLSFGDIRPGMRIEASGAAGTDGTLRAQDLIIIGTIQAGGSNTLPALDQLEQAIGRFYIAVSRREPAIARQFLTPELGAQLSDQDLSVGPEVQTLSVLYTQSSMVTPSRVIYTVGVAARVTDSPTGEWQAGQNNRFVEFRPTPQGWLISRISADPIT